MSGFLFDIQIEELQFSEYIHALHGTVWLLLKADGIQQTIKGPQMSTRGIARFQFPCRLVLNLPQLEGYWFKSSLWSFDENQGRQIAIASSQVRLDTLPKAGAQRFSYPLLNVQNSRVTAAMVTASTSIRPIAFVPRTLMISPQPQNGKVSRSNPVR
jgi:hypothetical protein